MVCIINVQTLNFSNLVDLVINLDKSKDKDLGDQKDYCPYCEKPFSRVSLHLQKLHSNEKNVIQYMSCKKQKMKNALKMRLRNLGNHLHNIKVLQSGEGSCIVTHRPKYQGRSASTSEDSYLPCVHCFDYYDKNELWKHARVCIFQQEGVEQNYQMRYIYLGKLLLASESHAAAQVHKLTSKMADDIVTHVVKEDRLINKLCFLFCLMHESNKEKLADIGHSLRLAAMLLIELRKLVPGIIAFENFIDPNYFKYFVQAAGNIGKCNNATKNLSESDILRIGWLLKKLVMLIETDDIENFQSKKREQAVAFAVIINKWWKNSCLNNIVRSNNQKITLFSVAENVKMLSLYLIGRIHGHSSKLKEFGGNSLHYNALLNCLLSFIILFNMKWGNVVANMTVHGYKCQHAGSILSKLSSSKLQMELYKGLRYIEVHGRNGRVFPIFLNEMIKDALRLLFLCRKPIGIPRENQHVFINSSGAQITGCSTLNDAAMECGALTPNILGAPELRKHVMTMTQLFNSTEKKLDILATHLELDDTVRQTFHQLPHDASQVAKVSKIIFLQEKGVFDNTLSKSYDELDMNLDEEIKSKIILFHFQIMIKVEHSVKMRKHENTWIFTFVYTYIERCD